MKKVIFIVISALFAFTLISEAKETEDAKIYCKDSKVKFRRGVKVYGNGKYNPVYETIPDKFKGRKITKYKPHSTEPLEFEVREAGIVTIVANITSAKKLKKQGWIHVDETIIKGLGSPLELLILQKKLDAGEYSLPRASSLYEFRLVI